MMNQNFYTGMGYDLPQEMMYGANIPVMNWDPATMMSGGFPP